MAGKLSTVILALTIALHPTPVLAPISFCLPDKEQVPVPVLAPVIIPEVVQEYQELEPQEPEPETVIFEATAYTWTGNRTATGTWPSRGTIAVDPRVIPLGTELHIEGYGEGIAEDIGGAIRGNIIDVYLPTEAECWQWGRRQVEVRVIE